jgi:hypothetical protein
MSLPLLSSGNHLRPISTGLTDIEMQSVFLIFYKNENISAARSEEEQAIRQLLFECTENFTSLSKPVD